jgi:hypothetical protein
MEPVGRPTLDRDPSIHYWTGRFRAQASGRPFRLAEMDRLRAQASGRSFQWAEEGSFARTSVGMVV